MRIFELHTMKLSRCHSYLQWNIRFSNNNFFCFTKARQNKTNATQINVVIIHTQRSTERICFELDSSNCLHISIRTEIATATLLEYFVFSFSLISKCENSGKSSKESLLVDLREIEQKNDLQSLLQQNHRQHSCIETLCWF